MLRPSFAASAARPLPSLLAVLVLLAALSGPPASAQTVSPRLYVANQMGGTITVVDPGGYKRITTIDLGTGSQPKGLAVHPNRQHLFVASPSVGVIVVETATNEVIATIPIPQGNVWAVAINRAGTRLYALAVAPGGEQVVAIDATTSAITGAGSLPTPAGCPCSTMLAVAQDDAEVYVANGNPGGIIRLDAASLALVGREVPSTATYVGPLAVQPTTGRVFGFAGGGPSPPSVPVRPVSFDPVTWASAPLPEAIVGDVPQAMAFNPAGTRLYTLNMPAGTVSTIDPAAGQILGTVALPSAYWGNVGAPQYVGQMVAVRPDGRYVYAAVPGANLMAVIDLAKSAVALTVPVGWAPVAVAYKP